jgi:hypothetical protein
LKNWRKEFEEWKIKSLVGNMNGSDDSVPKKKASGIHKKPQKKINTVKVVFAIGMHYQF